MIVTRTRFPLLSRDSGEKFFASHHEEPLRVGFQKKKILLF
jgi:hypothetical protein